MKVCSCIPATTLDSQDESLTRFARQSRPKVWYRGIGTPERKAAGFGQAMDNKHRGYLDTLAELTRMLRSKVQLSQEELSGAAGVATKSVARIEAGTKVSDDTLRAIGNSFTMATGDIVDLLNPAQVNALYQKFKQKADSERTPSALDLVSVRNLREAGEISDEHGSLGLKDLYVTRDCETEIIAAIRDIGEPLFVTAPAGSGKTSTLWRIANRMIADGAVIYFFRADFLVSDDGFEKARDIPFSVHAKSYIIADTVDSVVGQSESRQRLEDLIQNFQRKGYGVIAAIRPAEKNRFSPAREAFQFRTPTITGSFRGLSKAM